MECANCTSGKCVPVCEHDHNEVLSWMKQRAKQLGMTLDEYIASYTDPKDQDIPWLTVPPVMEVKVTE